VFVVGYFPTQLRLGADALGPRSERRFRRALRSRRSATWAQAAGGSGRDLLTASRDRRPWAVVSGIFAPPARFGGVSLSAKGLSGLFVAEIDRAGKFTSASAAEEINAAYTTIARAPGKSLYIAGSFVARPCSPDSAPGACEQDVFLCGTRSPERKRQPAASFTLSVSGGRDCPRSGRP